MIQTRGARKAKLREIAWLMVCVGLGFSLYGCKDETKPKLPEYTIRVFTGPEGHFVVWWPNSGDLFDSREHNVTVLERDDPGEVWVKNKSGGLPFVTVTWTKTENDSSVYRIMAGKDCWKIFDPERWPDTPGCEDD